MVFKGYGKTQPITPNTTDDNGAKTGVLSLRLLRNKFCKRIKKGGFSTSLFVIN
jgi:outer membrane protein OmpA-like peptidoglycan-associated protein